MEIKGDSASSHQNLHHNTDHQYIFETISLPENMNFMPVLGNGHVGFQVMSDSVHLNGLYNGEKGLSHRARIPNYANILITNFAELNGSVKYAMDVRSGIFRTSFSPKSAAYKLDHLIYAHRFYSRAIVNQLFISLLNCTTGENTAAEVDGVVIKIGQYPGNATDDIEFAASGSEGVQPRETDGKNPTEGVPIRKICGSTKTVEDPIYQQDPSNCCVLWNHVPEEITLGTTRKTSMSFTFVMTVDEHFSVAEQEMMDVLAQTDLDLLDTHIREWKHFWDDFAVELDNSDDALSLSRTIHASIFYLASSLPSPSVNQPRSAFGGLSPTGLGRGGSNLSDYEGHVFWDAETWMHPPILLMSPVWSAEMLHYRATKAFPAAQDYAKETGYSGIRFPWESAFTGREVTQPCCPLVAANQQHVTADISHALRLHLAATRDIHWLKREGCKLAIPIAQFWASRAKFNGTTGKYDIRRNEDVMGPDEDHEDVDNNVYTNIAAKQALQFGQFAACVCDDSEQGNWTRIADNMAIPYDSQLNYHPQFEGYRPGMQIKQADAVLAGYPLQFPMPPATRRNDLAMYENVTRATGPAMTWAMYAINHLDLGARDRAADMLARSYRHNVELPFLVWRELSAERADTGAVNFLTGAGGFLQAIMFGYAGIRIHLDRLVLQRPSLPPAAAHFRLRGIHFLRSRFTLTIAAQSVRVEFTECGRDLTIVIGASQQDVICGAHSRVYDITNQYAEIRPKSDSDFHSCHMSSH
ncbi:protein-glucosylgalactosylhydroxylysine glucosidase-like [Phlebotomus argentipes]|uniref:protein-glucosylgalactosylhydroxylysine glucosidase-like n=1 Tax=Phlebotomus argentipes TaxID=94469 RepID=UPI0028933CB9|nr:protein-glucosylgalactosylhydroxylysine glucosidase-like [Phlebotomus argentipes]